MKRQKVSEKNEKVPPKMKFWKKQAVGNLNQKIILTEAALWQARMCSWSRRRYSLPGTNPKILIQLTFLMILTIWGFFIFSVMAF